MRFYLSFAPGFILTLLRRVAVVLLALPAMFGPLRAETDVIGVYLTWLRDPSTTMVVNWVNLYPDTLAQVWHRAAGEAQWSATRGLCSAVSPSVLQVRRVELTGLAPDTVYEFVLGGAVAPVPEEKGRLVERFRTPPARLDRPVRFVAGGDMMHRRAWLEAMNRQAGALDPDFALLGGDLAYADGKYASRWIDWLQSMHRDLRAPDGRLIPLVLVIGNHEVRGHYNGRIPDDAPYFYGFFALPGNLSYNALDFGDYLSLLALDTDHTRPVSGAQTAWLDGALAERASRPFVFPCYHYPAYGTTKRPKEGGLPSDHPLSKKIQREWSPLFERSGVTAVFENDHHAYKRTHPIRAGVRDDAKGIVYLGDGAWGVETRPVATPLEAWYLARSEPRRHVFLVTLSAAGVAEVQAIDASGEVFDRTSLTSRRAR
jgi:acid phosphatase type 7